jgi:hypothetical protein
MLSSKSLVRISVAGLMVIMLLFLWFLIEGRRLKYQGPARVTQLDEKTSRVVKQMLEPNTPAGRVIIRGMVRDGWGRPLSSGVVSILGGFDRQLDGIHATLKLNKLGMFNVPVDPGQQYSVEVDSDLWGKVSVEKRIVNEDLELGVAYQLLSGVEGQIQGTDEQLASYRYASRDLAVEGPLNKEENAFTVPLKVPVTIDEETCSFRQMGLGPGLYKITGSFRAMPIEEIFEIPKNGQVVKAIVNLEALPEQEFVGKAVFKQSGKPVVRTRITGEVMAFDTARSLPASETDEKGNFTFSSKALSHGAVLRLSRGADTSFAEVVYGGPREHLVEFPDPVS